jgi:hypothetical protein
MTEYDLKKAKALKAEIKKLKATINLLPKLKGQYTEMEYKVRKEFYDTNYLDWGQSLENLKKKLTFTEKIKLVIYNGNKEN